MELEQLIGRAKQGDLDAFTDVTRRFQHMAFRSALSVWQASHGLGPWIWWHNFERIMQAVDDLDCLEVLD